jgi:hypothetical protein
MCHNMMIRRDNRQKTRCESEICHRNDQLEDFQPSILLLIDFYDTIGKFHAIEHDIVINAWAIGAICHATGRSGRQGRRARKPALMRDPALQGDWPAFWRALSFQRFQTLIKTLRTF